MIKNTQIKTYNKINIDIEIIRNTNTNYKTVIKDKYIIQFRIKNIYIRIHNSLTYLQFYKGNTRIY